MIVGPGAPTYSIYKEEIEIIRCVLVDRAVFAFMYVVLQKLRFLSKKLCEVNQYTFKS